MADHCQMFHCTNEPTLYLLEFSSRHKLFGVVMQPDHLIVYHVCVSCANNYGLDYKSDFERQYKHKFISEDEFTVLKIMEYTVGEVISQIDEWFPDVD
jgi:hypothetical protein